MGVHRTEYTGVCPKCGQTVELVEDRCVSMSLFVLIPHLKQNEERCEGSEMRAGRTGFGMFMGPYGGQGI